jgi:capsid protein
VSLGNGAIVELGTNESIDSANPGRPNAQFAPFVDAIITQVGMRLGIPREVLVKSYTSSYTAAQAALLDAWRTFRTRRDRHAMMFCQPIYEAWLDEAVAVGYVAAPGYFSNALVRRAWQGAQWVGDGPGAIRPDIAVESAERRIELGIITLEAESVLHDGVKWSSKYAQLTREATQMASLRRLRGDVPRPVGRPAVQPGQDDPSNPEDPAQDAVPPGQQSAPQGMPQGGRQRIS